MKWRGAAFAWRVPGCGGPGKSEKAEK